MNLYANHIKPFVTQFISICPSFSDKIDAMKCFSSKNVYICSSTHSSRNVYTVKWQFQYAFVLNGRDIALKHGNMKP